MSKKATTKNELFTVDEDGNPVGEPLSLENIPDFEPAPPLESMVYLGPSILGVAVSNTVFLGSEPKALRELAAQHPCIRALILPVSQMAEARNAITQKSGLPYRLYQEAQKIKDKMTGGN